MMYCLDTSVAIEFLRENKAVVEKIGRVHAERGEICITPVALCELYKGVFLSLKKDTQLPIMEQFIESLILLDFTRDASRLFGELYAQLYSKGKMTQENDLMIAAIAKAHGATLITRNKKHFEHTGIKIEEW